MACPFQGNLGVQLGRRRRGVFNLFKRGDLALPCSACTTYLCPPQASALHGKHTMHGKAHCAASTFTIINYLYVLLMGLQYKTFLLSAVIS